MLEIKNLNFTINNAKILKNISLRFKKGEMVVLIGPNGAGKSSLLKAIAKLVTPQSGEVLIDSNNLLLKKREIISQNISYMAQFPNTTNLLTKEVIALGRGVFGGSFLEGREREIIDSYITKLELEPFLERNIDTLSGGERQKIYLALSLIQTPKVLLLDEPTSHLDPKNQLEILEIVKKETIEKNIITIVVLHDLQSALHFGEKILMMQGGEVRGFVEKKELTSSHLESLFQVECKIFWIEGHPYIHFGHRHVDNGINHNHKEKKP